MVSHRVDTASNVSHLSAMKGSAYSARMVMNKSCFTSDVSDTSFSVAMYMPKIGGAGNNAKGTDTSSRDNQSNGDDRSYEYKSHEEDKSFQSPASGLVKQSKKMKRKK